MAVRKRDIDRAAVKVWDAEEAFADIKAAARAKAEEAAMAAIQEGASFGDAQRIYGRTLGKARQTAKWRKASAHMRECDLELQALRRAAAGAGDAIAEPDAIKVTAGAQTPGEEG